MPTGEGLEVQSSGGAGTSRVLGVSGMDEGLAPTPPCSTTSISGGDVLPDPGSPRSPVVSGVAMPPCSDQSGPEGSPPGETEKGLFKGSGLASEPCPSMVQDRSPGPSPGVALPATVPGQDPFQSRESSVLPREHLTEGETGRRTPHVQIERGSHGAIGYTKDTQGFTPYLRAGDRAAREGRVISVTGALPSTQSP